MLAAIYARQSADKPDSVSIEAQIERCRSACLARGLEAEVYADAGYSGKNIDRPGFTRLLEDLKNDRVCAVVAYKLDRISRSIADFAQLLSLFERHGVSFISVTEQFDTSSPAGRAMIYIIMVFAQLERETITQRVSDNYRYRAAMGLYMGGGVPFGYARRQIQLGGKKAAILTPAAGQAEIVKEIYRRYLEGMNTRGVAAHINAACAQALAGKRFTGGAVARLLRCMTYCGNSPELYDYLVRRGCEIPGGRGQFDGRSGMFLFKGCADQQSGKQCPARAVIGRHEPLIAAHDWIMAQNKLDRSTVSQPSPRRSQRHFLAGLLTCGECGGRFGLKASKAGHDYYYCRDRLTHPERPCGNAVWLPAAAFDDAVQKLLLRHFKALFAKGPAAIVPTAPGREAAEITQKLYDCRSEIDHLVASLGHGEPLDGYIRQHIEAAHRRKNELQRQLDALSRGEKAAKTKGGDPLRAISGIIDEAFLNAAISDRCRLARALIDHIEIRKDARVLICYRA